MINDTPYIDREPTGRGRDWELVRYVGRHGIVSIEHVMAAMGVRRAAAYRRVARCVEAGLLERRQVLGYEPSLIRATRQGIEYAGLGLPVASFSPGGVEHYLRCASVAQKLLDAYEDAFVLTEQEIAVVEAIEERPVVSATIGDMRTSGRLHRADLAVFSKGNLIAVEVELSPKSPRRLATIIRAWRVAIASGLVTEVHYVCRPGKTHRAVCRAAKRAKAEGCIGIFEGVPGL